MTSSPPAPAPFFLPVAGQGARFCLYHAPAGPCTAALVYLHPFAEEMNRSRRMAALAARALAAQGVAVLQIDLLGCGDSSGDFADANWEAWRADVALAVSWLRERSGHVPGLWGLRTGALLALDCARGTGCARLLLWQPVHSGAQYLTQFLRLQLAADMLDQQQAARNTTAALRAALRAGTPLEVAGYTLSPALADALDGLDSKTLAPPCPTHWFELAPDAGRTLPPAGASVLQAWQAQGADVQVQVVAGAPFWSTPEIAISPALLDATTAIFGAGHAA
ncbi:hydrolase 2, exosortase A system-associated [Duganella sp. FT92W]|uniref:Hydrolase 2, exosortase A system-associated n=1 Tax=Pseudoduganella rivuli TaxID=2666085 RepID=A0A7X2ITQ8_9BURK|nr:hydrolase 2, exosortase A system-associated [Pseudoduganella rivuli]MRV75864.1 hydrolase 2, exosortase A system-associated [Pseudoduganella rivuli]